MAVSVNKSAWVTGGRFPAWQPPAAPVPVKAAARPAPLGKLAPPLRVTGPLRGRGDELGTKRSPDLPPLAYGLGQCHALAVGHRLVLTHRSFDTSDQNHRWSSSSEAALPKAHTSGDSTGASARDCPKR